MRSILKIMAMLLLYGLLPLIEQQAAQAQLPIATVTKVENAAALNALFKASSASGKISYDLLQDAGGEIFWVVPLVDSTAVELFSVDMDDNSKLILGENILGNKITMDNGEAFVLRMLEPEGMPNLALCLTDLGSEGQERSCWIPRYNGMDGALTLDPGFVPASGLDSAKFEQAEAPLIDGGVLNDDLQPLVMVKTIADKNELDALGEFKPSEPQTLLLLPIVEPLVIEVWTVEHTVGQLEDDISTKEKIAVNTLQDSQALVFPPS